MSTKKNFPSSLKSDPNDLLVYMRVAMNHLHNRAERTAYMWEGEDHLYIQEKEKKATYTHRRGAYQRSNLEQKGENGILRSSKGGPFMIQKLFNFYPKHHRIIPHIKNLRSGANDRLNYTCHCYDTAGYEMFIMYIKSCIRKDDYYLFKPEIKIFLFFK